MSFGIGHKFMLGRFTYEVTGKLAEGGNGVTYLAARSPLPKNFVIKVPLAADLADEAKRQRFDREAKILANCQHPNVVKSVAYINDATGKALLQEYVEGATDIRKYVTANPSSAGSVLLQVLYAARAFHTEVVPGIVHRDLSPSNILVTGDGTVKVIDFGIAKQDPRETTTLTTTHIGMGTLGCMAPEQLENAAGATFRSDLYAIGMTFAASLLNVSIQHVQLHEVDDTWRSVCINLARRRPEDRPASAEEAIDQVMLTIKTHGLPLTDMDRHVEEYGLSAPRRPRTIPSVFAALISRHLNTDLVSLEQPDIERAAKLRDEVFEDATFDARGLFERVEASETMNEFETGTVAWSDGDALGAVYKRLYPRLDETQKLRCFQRMVTVAIMLHRYSVMYAVREVAREERDPKLTAQLMAIVESEDPHGVIHGLPRHLSSGSPPPPTSTLDRHDSLPLDDPPESDPTPDSVPF